MVPILSATGQRRETPASYEPIPSAAVDPSTLTSFATPMPHGLSSSPVSFNSYSVAMTNGIDQTRATTMIMLTEDESRFVGSSWGTAFHVTIHTALSVGM